MIKKSLGNKTLLPKDAGNKHMEQSLEDGSRKTLKRAQRGGEICRRDFWSVRSTANVVNTARVESNALTIRKRGDLKKAGKQKQNGPIVRSRYARQFEKPETTP